MFKFDISIVIFYRTQCSIETKLTAAGNVPADWEAAMVGSAIRSERDQHRWAGRRHLCAVATARLDKNVSSCRSVVHGDIVPASWSVPLQLHVVERYSYCLQHCVIGIWLT